MSDDLEMLREERDMLRQELRQAREEITELAQELAQERILTQSLLATSDGDGT